MIVFDGLIFYISPAFFNDPFDSVLPPVPKIVPTLNERQDIIAELKKIHKIKKKTRTAIYLGCNMPEHYQMEISQHYRDSSVKVYKMQLSESEFDFNFESIN